MTSKTPFTHKHLIAAIVFLTVAVIALRGPHIPSPGETEALARSAAEIPSHLQQSAANARVTAQKWHPDATLIGIDLRKGNGFAPVFHFASSLQREGLDVILQDGRMITLPAGPDFNPGAIPLPAGFIDPQAAIAAAQEQGMSGTIGAARLREDLSGAPVWILTDAAGEHTQFAINALTAQPMPKVDIAPWAH